MNNTDPNSLYSHYYQAQVQKELCWFVTSTLRSYEHLAFDRTIDTTSSTFEFFVAPTAEQVFLEIMNYYQKNNLITNLVKLPNRLALNDTV